MTENPMDILAMIMIGSQYAGIFFLLGIGLLLSVALPIKQFRRLRVVLGLLSLLIGLLIIAYMKSMSTG